MDTNALWKRYQDLHLRYQTPPISLDISRMHFEESWLESMEPKCTEAMAHLEKLEAGEKVNTDEGRMVGHYWLRKPELAPTEEIQQQIRNDLRTCQDLAARIHNGTLTAQNGEKFSAILIIGIGGSALGPQLVTDALVGKDAPVKTWFFDNTDPDGMDRTLGEIGDELATTLSIVISKSGGTPETRNGMVEAKAAYEARGLDFGKHAVAVTGLDSKLDNLAKAEGWLEQVAMPDWVGGRTSIMSVVGLVPHAIQGVDLEQFLAGAHDMDAQTRRPETRGNAAMLMALMWYSATKGQEANGKARKDMVILPYKDRLVLLSKYLQQLVMESVGKERDLDGRVVHEGIAVYGNKGSTDQHAYVQQLRDGTNNFFAVFIEVLEGRSGDSIAVEDSGATSGDYLQGFLRGTRSALAESDRESITITVPAVDAYVLGVLIALFERAVTFYASLVNINAYHQPGVEAGKKAATSFLDLFGRVKAHLESNPGSNFTADELATAIEPAPENIYHICNHLAANTAVQVTRGEGPANDRFGIS